MARHQRMPTQEAGYTYAVVPCLPKQIACNEKESIYGYSGMVRIPIQVRHEPRYQAAWAERERRIAVQRETLDVERNPEK